MDIIVITRPDFYEGETGQVIRLFENGIRRLHLRKPKATEQETAEWIERIPECYRNRIVLHDHHRLAKAMMLGGIHLNGRNPETPSWVEDVRATRSFTLSRSCHSIDELRRWSDVCDYLFLSPIFDSISKEGYGSAFSPETLLELREEGLLDGVYALGGVSPANLDDIQTWGFSGAAMLGAVWQEGYLL